MEVAQEILRQLGGRRFMVMTGASGMIGDDKSLFFKLPNTKDFVKDGINYVGIHLTEKDLYSVFYYRKWGKKIELKDFAIDIYNDMLVEDFEKKTGLYTRW